MLSSISDENMCMRADLNGLERTVTVLFIEDGMAAQQDTCWWVVFDDERDFCALGQVVSFQQNVLFGSKSKLRRSQ